MSTRIIKLFFVYFISMVTIYAQNLGDIEGILYTEDNLPLKNVNVVLEETTHGAISDETGSFILNRIPVGDYKLTVSALGYKTVSRNVEVKAGESTSLTIIMHTGFSQLSEVTIKGEAMREKNRSITRNTIKTSRIKSMNVQDPTELLNQIPGVELLSYHQGGTASVFAMRGFGQGGHGGDIAIQIDGVPLNESAGHGDGYADMNIIIPLNIKEVDVYKGPSSVLFGNYANGGAISFETRKGGDYQDYSLTGGSYNTVDFQMARGNTIQLNNEKELRTNIAAQIHSSDGFIENSEYLKGNFSGRLGYDLTDKTDIALSLVGHSSQWNAPGFITAEELADKTRRNKQSANAQDDGGNKTFASERIDVNHTINEDLRLLVFGYSLQNDFTRFSRFDAGPVDLGQNEDRNIQVIYSGGASLNGSSKIGSMDVDWLGGAEYYHEKFNKRGWETENRVRATDADGNELMLQNDHFTFQTLSFYAEGVFDISKYFRPSIGLRYDSFYLQNKNVLDNNKTTSYNNLTNLSPKIGVVSNLFDGLEVRASATNGFTLPPTGSIAAYKESDFKVKPIKMWQYEMGVNYAFNNKLSADLAAFIIDRSGETYEQAHGTDNWIAAGEVRRNGVELGAEYTPVSNLYLRGSFSYIDTKVKENEDADLIGNRIDGIPKTTFSLEADYRLQNGIGLRVDMRDIGEYATGLDNLNFYEGYTVANAELYYNFGKTSKNTRLFLEVNNILNKSYATTAFDFSQTPYYSPAPLRNFNVGIKYSL